MGAGIAKIIKREFPEAFVADSKTKCGDRSKLGDISYATVKVGKYILTVVNGYTQYNHTGKPPLVEYRAVRSVFKKVHDLFIQRDIGYPKIGAGLAGGDWNIIKKIIDEELSGEDHTLVVL